MALALTAEAPASVLAGALGRAWAAVRGTVAGAALPWRAWFRVTAADLSFATVLAAAPWRAWFGVTATGVREAAVLAAAPWRAWASMVGAPTWTAAEVALTTRSGDAPERAARALGSALATTGARVTGAMAEHADRPRRRRRAPSPRQVFKVLVWTVVLTFVGAFATSLALPYWYQLHGQRLLVVTSGSMSPFVEAGDVAVLQLIDDPSQLAVGQVATFYPPGSNHLVTHRIVDLQMYPVMVQNTLTGRMEAQLDTSGSPIMRPYIFTKGDANETRDPNATPLSGVRGVVVDAKADWGRWLGWAQSKVGRLALLAPPLLLLATLELVDSLAERRRAPARRPAPRREVDDALGAF
ncbi:hypothetical protein OEB99_11225 [Actinotalea sp. M2MS4P-6]|uniref:hypothetical protein n=1 Tax=Actinotalea sp. M2MS4P-6 TaxID=2983762 RepID=UPI0021E47D05|nr:hypothetical protein [Actinotalea sp. M2MS4P-6]MCV2394882.1 hypothetical protein [Actinotalea sp. M2MS4P-6]